MGYPNRKSYGCWVVNKEVNFAFRAERQKCITNVRTWHEHLGRVKRKCQDPRQRQSWLSREHEEGQCG